MSEILNINKFINKLEEIYTIPEVALKVIQKTTDTEVKITDLSNLIEADFALTSNILKVVNSGYFNFQDEITTIKKAIVLLGLKLTKEVTISFAVKSLMKGLTKISKIDYKNIWRHSAYCAIFSKKMAEYFKEDADNLYISGLLHDIGIIVEILYDYEMINKIFSAATDESVPFFIKEKELWDIKHTETAITLLSNWKISPQIYSPIRYHHNVSDIYENDLPYKKKIYLLYIANIITHLYIGDSGFYRELLTKELLNNIEISEEKFWDLVNQFTDDIKSEEEFISLLF